MFVALQRAYAEAQSLEASTGREVAPTEDLKGLALELLELDRANIEKMRRRLGEIRGDVNRVQQQRRSLAAYGWVDPVHAPKGAFIDTMQG